MAEQNQDAPLEDAISGDELAALLGQLDAPAPATPPPPSAAIAAAAAEVFDDAISADELEALGIAVSKTPPPAPVAPPIPAPVAPAAPPKVATHASVGSEPKLPELTPEENIAPDAGLGLLMDVPLRVSIELGRISMTLQQVLGLGRGSIVELERLAGEAVDILVNDKLIGRGEVVVIDEYFGVKITELIEPKG